MLDQERCILCSRCVRFTDEITGTGEFGIFNRGDHAEVGLYPGHELNNRYSANVVDICPVGALTERDFRFKARVWYLSTAPSVCNGCSQGCNMDIHYVLDRPHLNDGARMVRVKPRYNKDVNKWWLCDEGRFGLGWIDRARLTTVRGPSADATWEQALAAISTALTGRVGVIASARLTNEELFLITEIFRNLGAQVTASVPEQPGTSDDFLIKADKNPNTLGATLMGMAGPGAPGAEEIVDAALAEKLDVLWVFGHDIAGLFGREKVEELSKKVGLFIFSGTNENPTAALAHWVLPTAAYVEKDGTFVNCHGRVQRIGRAFPPLKDSREDWRVLLELAAKLGITLGWNSPEEIFIGLARSVPSFGGLTYETIGSTGIEVPVKGQGAGVAS
jgi:NADH-quinone oxidoreductase subunit G